MKGKVRMSRVYLLLFCVFIFETAIVHGASDKSVKTEITNHSKVYLSEGLTAASLLCVDALMSTKRSLLTQSNEYSNETEQDLKDQGFNEKLITGLNHVMENLRFAQSLRDRLSDKSTDPNTLHIPEFAELIDVHIAFIEEGIKSQSSADKSERLELLEILKFEVQHRKSSKTVTYRYWFNLNLRLSLLTTPKERLEKIFNDFQNRRARSAEIFGVNMDANNYYNPQFEEAFDYLREWMVDDSELESYYKIIQGLNDGINFIGRNNGVNRSQKIVLDTISAIEANLRPDERSKMERFLYLTRIGFIDTEYEFFEFVNLLHDFPRIIIIPTIHHDLGPISINKAYGTGVVFIKLDRTPNSYQRFLERLYCNVFVCIDNSKIRAHFQSMLGRLPKTQREIIEVIYFSATYENEKSLEEFPSGWDEHNLENYGYIVDRAFWKEFDHLYIQLLISSWVEGRGVEGTVTMVEKYLDGYPELKKDILDILERLGRG